MEGYKTGQSYMEGLRTAIFEYDIKPIPQQAYQNQLEPLTMDEDEQTNTDIRLFLDRIPLQEEGQEAPMTGVLRPEKLDNLASAYRRSVAKMLVQIGSAAIMLDRRYQEPSFKQIFDDDRLRGQVVRYMHRNHRRVIWSIAHGQLGSVTATVVGGSFALYHSAGEIDHLREEYPDLSHAVEATVVNSPRKVHSVLARMRIDYDRLKDDKRYADLGSNKILRNIVQRNPTNPEGALDAAIATFRTLTTNPKYAIFGAGRIRNMLSTSFSIQPRLDSALKKVDKLMKDPDYQVLGRKFLARAVITRPKKIGLYLQDVVNELKKIVDSKQFHRFTDKAIVDIIHVNPKDGWNTITRADDAMRRIEADPECVKFGISYMPQSVLRNPDPYKIFKEHIARFEKFRKQPAFGAMSDKALKHYTARRIDEGSET
jgi:hypothetical protein